MRPTSEHVQHPDAWPHRNAARRVLGLAALGLGMLVLASCAGATPHDPATPSVTDAAQPPSNLHIVFGLDFDGDDRLASTPLGAATVTEERAFDGDIDFVDSYKGGGTAAKFPAFVDSDKEPGVGLVVTAADAPLPDPGDAEFGWGATLRYDDPGAASDSDNGDNVLQRGLAADPVQFKLQADHGVPSCSVTGTAGRVLVKGELLTADVWYRVACLRTQDDLTLTVTDLTDETTATFRETGTTGTVDFADDVPIAIGRKVGPGGRMITDQPDQFNGTMDSVWVGIASH